MAPPPIKPGQYGFRDVDPNAPQRRRLIMSIEGPEKSGKNHFSFGMPGKIAFHSFDYGDEGVIEKFVKSGLKVQKAEYRLIIPDGAEPQKVSEAATPVWEAFKVNYRIGLATCRTTVVDTGTDAYELIRMSHFGKLQQVMAHHYAPVNAEMKAIIQQAYSSPGNLCVLHRVKDEYDRKVGKDGKEIATKTGRKVMAGFSQMKYETQVHLRMFKEVDPDGQPHRAEIVTCRQNPEIEGMVLQGEMLSFKGLGLMVYPESEEAEWE